MRWWRAEAQWRPPAITLDVVANRGGDTAEQWVKNTSESNHALSLDGDLRPVTLGGEPAVAYFWDGL